MVGAVTVWLGIGSLLAGIGLTIFLKYTGLLDGLSEVFAWIREMWASFLSVAPKPLKILLFLFFVLTIAGFITGCILNFMYICNSSNELKTYNNGFAGGLVGSLQSVFLGYDIGENSCIGWRSNGCYDFQNASDCNQFSNVTGSGSLCVWTGSSCDYDELENWAGKCDYMNLNITQCNLLECQYISDSVEFDAWISNHTVPAATYGVDTPEGMFYPTCQGYNPVLTFRGVNLFDFRVWLFLIIIFSLGGLAIKYRNQL